MFDEILACLDGSQLAQQILPLAHGITAAASATLTLLRVVADADELAAEESDLRQCARRYRAEVRFLLSADPAAARASGPHGYQSTGLFACCRR